MGLYARFYKRLQKQWKVGERLAVECHTNIGTWHCHIPILIVLTIGFNSGLFDADPLVGWAASQFRYQP
jgi:hypothetical protein